MRTGFFNGGRTFIDVGELFPETRDAFDWIVSWRGTYDWNALSG